MVLSWKEASAVPVSRKGIVLKVATNVLILLKASWEIGWYMQVKLASPSLYEGLAVAWAVR